MFCCLQHAASPDRADTAGADTRLLQSHDGHATHGGCRRTSLLPSKQRPVDPTAGGESEETVEEGTSSAGPSQAAPLCQRHAVSHVGQDGQQEMEGEVILCRRPVRAVPQPGTHSTLQLQAAKVPALVNANDGHRPCIVEFDNSGVNVLLLPIGV